VQTAALPRLKGLMFDLDGTLLLSDRSLGNYEILPGAAELLTELSRRTFPFVVLTNGSAYPPAEHAAKLRKLGLPVRDECMLTPSSVAADLMVRAGVRRVLVLGSVGVGQALRDAHIETVQVGARGERDVQAVYVGWYPECTMKAIEAACEAIWAGARLYVASDVPFFATKQGRTMGYSYAIVGAIRRVTRAPMILTGKPSLHALRFVARRLDTRPEDYEGAEISDGAGELGFFSPHSWWPIMIALSGSVAAVGIALWLPWLIFAGVVFVLASAAGLVFEYYIGPEKH